MIEPWERQESPLRMALLAVLVGIVGGYGAVAFRAMIGWIHNLAFLGIPSFEYNANVHTLQSPLDQWVILVPVVGALLVAFLVKNFAPEAKGHGVPEVMDAIYYQKGIIRPAVAAVKSLASAISIGTGGSVGREGPIIQIGSAFGSTLGQLIRASEAQRITLIACGAGAGIAATFNTPVGGLLFALELILPVVGPHTLIPVILSTGTATWIGRIYFGDYPAFDVPALTLSAAHATTPYVIAIYALFGVILGLVSVVFVHAIYAAEDLFDRIPGNYYSRHALGMALVGVMMYLLMKHTGHYYTEGVGYATVQDVLYRTLVDPRFLLLLFALKFLATCLTLGSGASGGIFSPSLYLGATLGGAYALAFNEILVDGMHVDPVSMAVVGMAGLVGGVTGAAVTAMVMIFEMTRDYNVILPVLVTVSLAYGTRRMVTRNSIYTLKLIRRGHYIPESLQTNRFMLHSNAESVTTPMVLMQQPDWERRSRLRERRGRRRAHVVVLDRDKVVGVVPAGARRRVRRVLGGMSDLGSPFVVADARGSLLDLMAQMRQEDAEAAVVTTSGSLDKPSNILGVIDWNDIARASELPLSILLRKPKVTGV
ncbi:MAG: chloride channel protein [Chromatiaceae bacterium]